MTSETFVGIDISKRWLEVQVHGKAESWKAGDDAEGQITLVEQMKAVQADLIVFEATGGYERKAVKALSEGALPWRWSIRPGCAGLRKVWGCWPRQTRSMPR